MIESAEAMVKIHDIARSGAGHLDSLLFAAEDCELVHRPGETRYMVGGHRTAPVLSGVADTINEKHELINCRLCRCWDHSYRE